MPSRLEKVRPPRSRGPSKASSINSRDLRTSGTSPTCHLRALSRLSRDALLCLTRALRTTGADLEWVAKNNGFTALRTGRDHIDGTLGNIFKILEIALGFHRKLFIRGRTGGRAGPSLESFCTPVHSRSALGDRPACLDRAFPDTDSRCRLSVPCSRRARPASSRPAM